MDEGDEEPIKNLILNFTADYGLFGELSSTFLPITACSHLQLVWKVRVFFYQNIKVL